jgi:hypothetical protein
LHSDRERHVHEDNGDTRIAAGARAVIARTAAGKRRESRHAKENVSCASVRPSGLLSVRCCSMVAFQTVNCGTNVAERGETHEAIAGSQGDPDARYASFPSDLRKSPRIQRQPTQRSS